MLDSCGEACQAPSWLRLEDGPLPLPLPPPLLLLALRQLPGSCSWLVDNCSWLADRPMRLSRGLVPGLARADKSSGSSTADALPHGVLTSAAAA
jgi:hypothetical protein